MEQAKHQGTSSRASNGQELAGTTAGRGRQDPQHQAAQSRKRVFVYPLTRRARESLRQMPVPPRLARAQPVAGIQEVRLPRRANRPARTAKLEARFGAVELRAPKRRGKLPKVPLRAVWARETEAPAGVEPVEWMLLTPLPVENFEQACEKLAWYTRRWGIEVFHRIVKSGCKNETRQLGHADRIEACLAIDLVVAWRIFHLTKLGRETTDVACTVYFEEVEWQALVGFIHNRALSISLVLPKKAAKARWVPRFTNRTGCRVAGSKNST